MLIISFCETSDMEFSFLVLLLTTGFRLNERGGNSSSVEMISWTSCTSITFCLEVLSFCTLNSVCRVSSGYRIHYGTEQNDSLIRTQTLAQSVISVYSLGLSRNEPSNTGAAIAGTVTKQLLKDAYSKVEKSISFCSRDITCLWTI